MQRFNLLCLDEGEYLFEEYAATMWCHGAGFPVELPAAPVRGRLRVCSRGLFFDPDNTALHIVKFPFRSMPGRPELLSSVPASLGALAGELAALLAAEQLGARDAFALQPRDAVLMKAGGVVAPYLHRGIGVEGEKSAHHAHAPAAAAAPQKGKGGGGGFFGAAKGSGGGGGGAAVAATPAPAAPAEGALATSRPTVLFAFALTSAADVLPSVARLWQIQAACADQASGRERAQLEALIARRRDGPFNLSLLSDYRERPLTRHAPFAPSAERVFPLVSCPGRVAVTASAFYFEPVPVNNLGGSDPLQKWALRDVVRVLRRPRLQRAVGLELVLAEGVGGSGTAGGSDLAAAGLPVDHPAAATVFLAFNSPGERDEVYGALVEALGALRGGGGGGARAPPVGDPLPAQLHDATLAWQARALSNYDYLMALNSAAGRTRADLAAYPVLPWVVADFTSRALDLDSAATFRDLSKPIGALNGARLAALRARFAEMPREGPDGEPPFLYGTHYSTPGYCLYYLARAMPEHMLRLQSGRFDAPDRMFFDVGTTWSGVTGTNQDLKELTPEFYASDGGFLLMPEGLNLGVRQNGRRLADVALPPWAYDAGDFVRQLREALECERVSAALHGWIDLVFGAAQRGAAAEAADNLFHPLTYEGAVNLDAEADPDRRAAMQAQIAEFGQTPRQLFATRHPRRGDAPAPPPALPPPPPPPPQQQAQPVKVADAPPPPQAAAQAQPAEEAAAEAAGPALKGGAAPEGGAAAAAATPPVDATSAPPIAPRQPAEYSAGGHFSWRALPLEAPPLLHAAGAHVHAVLCPLHGLAHSVGGDGALLCLGLGLAGGPANGGGREGLRVSVVSRGAPSPPASAGDAPPAAQLHGALYGDDAPLPLRAAATDGSGEAPEMLWVGGAGGEVHAAPCGGALGGGGRPLRIPGAASVTALGALTTRLGYGAGGIVEDSVTLVFVGGSDGALSAWQWSHDGGGWGGGGEPPAAVVPPFAAFEKPAPLTALLVSAPVSRGGGGGAAVGALLAVGDALGRVRVFCATVRRAPPGTGAGPLADGGGARAAVELRAVGGAGSDGGLCDPLARGDLFLGGASGVVGGTWCGVGEDQWLATGASDGRLIAWRCGGGAWWRGEGGGGGALAPAAVVATGEVLRAVALAPGGGAGGVVATAGNAGEVRLWALGALVAGAPAPPRLVPAAEALLRALPPAAEPGGAPYTALAVTALPGLPAGGACVLAGRRDGRISAWLLG